MSEDTKFTLAVIFIIFSFICFDQWIDYQKSKQATKIEYIYVPLYSTSANSDTLIMGSPEYYKKIRGIK